MVTATLPAGNKPVAVAVNPATNTAYVANLADGTVTAINGATNAVTTIHVGTQPQALAVNPVTNRIYVANGSGAVTVIDGAANGVTGTFTIGGTPLSVAVNPVINKVYVANLSNVTVIDANSQDAKVTVAAGSSPIGVAVNPVTNKIYVANLGGGVTVIDANNNNATTTVSAGSQPFAVAVNPVTNKIYVANNLSGTVTVIDANNNNATATVTVGGHPQALAVNSVTNKVYVANNASATVTVIDANNNNATATVNAGSQPIWIAVNAVTNQAYVANQGGNVTLIDGATNVPSTISTMGAVPVAVAVNPITNKIYVANNGSANVTVIDGAVNATAMVRSGSQPYAVAVNPATNRIYVANEGGDVTVIDGAANTMIGDVFVGAVPQAVAVNPITNKIYVANNGSANVTVIDGAANTVSATLMAGSQPVAVAVNPVTNKIYVVNNGSGNVTVIDGAANTVLATLPAGSHPFAVDVNPVTNKIYVANRDNGNVTVIDGATNTTLTVSTGASPLRFLAVNPVTNQIYVGTSAPAMAVIDGATNKTSILFSGLNVLVAAVNPITNKVYVATASGPLIVIDGITCQCTTPVNAGTSPNAVAVNPVTNKIYVTNLFSGSVTVIDGATNTTSTVGVGASPGSVAVNPATSEIYVTNQGDGTVTAITEEHVHAIPLQVTITALPANTANNPSPILIFTTQSTFSPVAPGPQDVFYQVDTWGGTWVRAGQFGQQKFDSNVGPLQPGIHTIFAYADDSQDATSTQMGSPLIGSIAAYTFLVLPSPGTVVSIAATGGTPQSEAVGFPFATNLRATVADGAGNPVSGVTVTFAAPSSGASATLGATTGVTDANGTVTTSIFAKGSTGSYTVNATAPGVPSPAVFTLTNISAHPSSMTATGGTPQDAPLNAAFASGLQVLVTDFSHSPVANAWVTFTAPTSGASGTFSNTASAQTNAAGIATAPTFTANGTLGTYAVTAKTSASSTTFTLTNGGTPSAVSVAPNGAAGLTQTFTATYSDTIGVSYLNYRFLLINSTLSGLGACWIWVDNNGIHLENDNDTVLLGPSSSNSQCTLNSGSVVNSGAISTVTVSLTFKAAFAGVKNIYTLATDTYGNSTDWLSKGTYTVQNAPSVPMPISVSPASGGGSTQTFTATYSDAAGASFLNYRFLLIHSTASLTGGCWVWTDNNGIYLENDNATVLMGPLNGSNSFSNSQCTLNSGSVVNSGPTSTVTVSVTFKSAFAGPKNVYMAATDTVGNGTAFVPMGTYNVLFTPSVPATVSLSPASSAGTTQTFTATYSDAAGAAFLNYRFLLIHSTASLTGGCWVWTDNRGIYLENDNATVLMGPLNGSNSFSNSQCTLNSGSVVNSGPTSTVTVSLTFKSAFAGPKNVYMAATDTLGNGTAFVPMGTYDVQYFPSVPAPVSVSPASGSGSTQTFTATYSDAAGAAFLNYRFLLIHSTASLTGGCWVWTDNRGIYLEDDNATVLMGPLNGSNSFSNSQCTLNSGSVVNSGPNSTVTVSITFKTAFAGPKNVYMAATDTQGNGSAFVPMGTYNVLFTPSAPVSVSVSPTSGASSTQTFTATYSDAAGAAFLNYRFLLINSTATLAGGCWVWTDNRGIYLENDNASVLMGPLNGSSSFSNSQCTLNSGSVVNSGPNSTVTVSITFKAAFSGLKNVYMADTDTLGNGSAFVAMGTYNVQ